MIVNGKQIINNAAYMAFVKENIRFERKHDLNCNENAITSFKTTNLFI